MQHLYVCLYLSMYLYLYLPLPLCLSGAVKVWDPRQKNDPVAVMEPADGDDRRDCWAVAFGKYSVLFLSLSVSVIVCVSVSLPALLCVLPVDKTFQVEIKTLLGVNYKTPMKTATAAAATVTTTLLLC